MYAVIRTGGKQYRVAPDDVIEVEKLSGAAGEAVEFGEVLMVGGDGAPKLGAPTVSDASVAGEVLEQKRGDKVLVFKKKRRQNYRRTAGHRQYLTAVRITEILTGGKKPSKSKTAEPAPAKQEGASGTKKASSSGKTAKAESTTKAGKQASAAKSADKKADTGKGGAGKTGTKKTGSGTGAAKKAEGASGGGKKQTGAKKSAAEKPAAKPDKD